MQYLAAAFLILLLLVPAAAAAAQAQPEVYASGMRNPYRWSFDRQTGDLYVGDVGGTNEEITFIPAAQGHGANLGWNCFSGTAVQSGCMPSNYFPPAYQYPSGPDVVIGGYVVRDPDLPSFAGRPAAPSSPHGSPSARASARPWSRPPRPPEPARARATRARVPARPPARSRRPRRRRAAAARWRRSRSRPRRAS